MTKETFINSFGEKMTREKPGDPPNPTITLEEIKLLEEALSNQHDSILKAIMKCCKRK